jgi:hypothetical protein
MNETTKKTERKKYEKPEIARHGNLKEITMTSFNPPPPRGGDQGGN